MKTCIYCKIGFSKKSKEHVIQRGFGTFNSDTWTLDCVCPDCNNLFGRTLDIELTRDSLEGVSRYNLSNKKSSESYKNKNIKFTFPNDFEIQELRNTLAFLDHQLGQLQVLPCAQIGFWSEKEKQYKFFLDSELENIDFEKEGLSKKGMRLLAPSEEKHSELEGKAKKMFGYKKKEDFFIDSSKINTSDKVVNFHIEGRITPIIRRAITKIAFNFLAKCTSPEFVLQKGFDEVRNFILKGGEEPKIDISNEPILYDENRNFRRMHNGFLIILENQNNKIICKIQFYHLFTYAILLSQNLQLEKDCGYAFLINQKPISLFQAKNLQKIGFIIPK